MWLPPAAAASKLLLVKAKLPRQPVAGRRILTSKGAEPCLLPGVAHAYPSFSSLPASVASGGGSFGACSGSRCCPIQSFVIDAVVVQPGAARQPFGQHPGSDFYRTCFYRTGFYHPGFYQASLHHPGIYGAFFYHSGFFCAAIFRARVHG